MDTEPATFAPAERVEQKFYTAPGDMVLALALVRRTCRRDGDYPEEQINSLYFDTPGLEQHEKSQAGEYAKAKVRIRWYGTETAVETPVWLELKERRGFVSTKQRWRTEVPEDALEPDVLGAGIVSNALLTRTMAGFGFFARERLCPVVVISYRRERFVEPRTGYRVAFDSHVRSTMVMPGIGRGERGLELPGAVIEVKGPAFILPGPLRRLADLGSSWTRFSKYSASLDAHASALGSVSRLWPSGRMQTE